MLVYQRVLASLGFGPITQALNTVAVSASAVGLCGCAALIGVSWDDDKSYGIFAHMGTFAAGGWLLHCWVFADLNHFGCFMLFPVIFFVTHEGHVFQTCFLRLQVFTKSSATSPKLSTLSTLESRSRRVCGESSVRRENQGAVAAERLPWTWQVEMGRLGETWGFDVMWQWKWIIYTLYI